MDTVSYRCDRCGDTRGWAGSGPTIRDRFFSGNKLAVCAGSGCFGTYQLVEQVHRSGPTQDVLRVLPDSAGERKGVPITTGVLDYFPLALVEIARLSKAGNDQHNPGQPLHWARGKSGDHADCLVRHLIQRGTIDSDGITHTAKVAWRALALLQEELEAQAGFIPGQGE